MCRAREVYANDTLSPAQKRSPSGSFFVAERVGSHTCAFSNAQGAQVCEANLMSRTKAIVGKEAKIKNKVCAGIEVVANDPTHLINPSSRFGGSVLSAKPTTKIAPNGLLLFWRREWDHTQNFFVNFICSI